MFPEGIYLYQCNKARPLEIYKYRGVYIFVAEGQVGYPR
jgi:hypothetical protein